MVSSVRGRLAAGLAAGCLILLLGSPVAAIVTAPCTAVGTSTSGDAVDLTTETVWHLRRTDTASGHGQSQVPMTSAKVWAYVLGIGLPIASGAGDGDTSGAVEAVDISPFANLGARFVVAGDASGDSGSCSLRITVVIDDVNPVLTILGGGGLLLFVLGLLVVVAGARSRGGAGQRIVAALFGGLGGAGLGLSLEQIGVIDPTTFVGLGIALGGLVIGFVLAGQARSRRA